MPRRETADRDLEQRDVARLGELLQPLHHVEALIGEERRITLVGQPRVARRLLAAAYLAGQHAVGQREERQDAEPEAQAGRRQLGFDRSLEQAVVVLRADELLDAQLARGPRRVG